MRLLRNSLLGLVALAVACAAGQGVPPELQGVGVTEKPGQQIDLNLTFTAENGYPVPLKTFFNEGRPVILNLVYYDCPMLCTRILNGQAEAMKLIPQTLGKDYEVVTVSINPAETFNLAQQKRALYMEEYGRASSGWHFLVDYDGNVKKLADEVGFRYRYDDRINQFAHTAVIMLLTPSGKVSRYLYGIKFNPLNLRLGLTEASNSKFAFSTDQLLLFCYHYDPQAKGYVLFATNLMRAGGVLTVILLGLLLFTMWRRERRRSAAGHPVGAR